MAKEKGYDYKKALLSITGLIVLFLILIFVNIIVSYANIRWDATEDNTYSLSEGTKNILSSMTAPVTIKLFYSQSNPDVPVNVKVYAKQVKDFLSEYTHAGKGQIKLEIYDPTPDSDEEEWAQKYGIKPMMTPHGKIYCGLVFVSADKEELIPWLDPSKEQVLEYDLTSIIQGFQRPEKKVVGIISSLPVFGTGGRPQFPGQASGSEEWIFVTEMKKICLSALVIIILLSAAACAQSVSSEVLQSEKQRITSPNVYESDMTTLADGNSAFAFDLYQALSETDG
ncbi:MAG: GldG family protein, partial [Proteobacteria bacterium]|nr:GldG family protein [Pseudomonadota bacterium]